MSEGLAQRRDITKIEIYNTDIKRVKLAKTKEEIKTGIKLCNAAFLSLLIKDGIKTRELE